MKHRFFDRGTHLFDRLRPCPKRLPLAGTEPEATGVEGASTRAQAGRVDFGLPLRALPPVRRVLTTAGGIDVPSLARRTCSPNSLVGGGVAEDENDDEASGKVGRRGEGGRSETSERNEALARRSAGNTAPDRRFESDSDDDDLRRGVGGGGKLAASDVAIEQVVEDADDEAAEVEPAGVGGGLGGRVDLREGEGSEANGADLGTSCRIRILCGPAAEAAAPEGLLPASCCCCCWALG